MPLTEEEKIARKKERNLIKMHEQIAKLYDLTFDEYKQKFHLFEYSKIKTCPHCGSMFTL